jgi:hypothetical protein
MSSRLLQHIAATAIFFVSGIFVCPLRESAHAFLGSDEYNISAFCSEPAPRRTIIYIDDQIMEDGNTSWANRLYQKLISSLLPAEPVSVVQLSPAVGSAKELWSACWPDYSQEKKDRLGKERPIFSKHPLKILETQQSVFRTGLAGALTRAYESGRRPKPEVASHREARKKNLIASIMADESRFHLARNAPRVIIYSDMIENSEYGNVQSDADYDKLGREIAEKLKFDSEGASVYVFGIDGASPQVKGSIEKARDLWSSFFKQANGYLAGFGSELNIPASPAVLVATYDIEVLVQNVQRFGRLRILADAKGQLQDSFLFFSPKANASIDGTFVCRNADRCILEAKTTAGTVTLSPREELRLEGPVQKLAGRLGFPNDVIEGGDTKNQTKAVFDVVAMLRQER